MKEIINKNFHLILIAILILVIGYWYLNSLKSLKDLLKRPKYTMALTTSDWHHKNTTGIGVDYEYFVNKKKYSNTINLSLEKGHKYLLIFDSLKPDNNVILEMYPLNGNLQVPINGWKLNELPIKIDTTKINDIVLGDE